MKFFGFFPTPTPITFLMVHPLGQEFITEANIWCNNTIYTHIYTFCFNCEFLYYKSLAFMHDVKNGVTPSNFSSNYFYL